MINKGNIEIIERVVLNKLGNKKFIEVQELIGLLSKLDLCYLFLNMYHLEHIELFDEDITRKIDYESHTVPYVKIRRKLKKGE